MFEQLQMWRPITGYEGLYEVSEFSNIKSLSRFVYSPLASIPYIIPEKILKKTKDKFGYSRVSLSKDGKVRKRQVHILSAIEFLSNPHNKKEVNHKKGVSAGDHVSNLEWATHQENIQHSYNILKRKPTWTGIKGASHPIFGRSREGCKKSMPWKGKFGKEHIRSKPICCPTLDISFGSLKEASSQTGISSVSIGKVLRGKQNNTQGLYFRYVNNR